MSAHSEAARRWRHEVRTSLNHVIGYSELVSDAMGMAAPPGLTASLAALLADARALLSDIEKRSPAPSQRHRTGPDHGPRLERMHGLASGVRATLRELRLEAQTGDMDHALRALEKLDRALTGSSPLHLHMRRESLTTAPIREEGGASAGTVLIVDDDAANRDLLARAVRLLGHHVVEAAGGVAALAIAREQGVDVVLLDLRMPDMDGHQVLQAMQADASMRNVPVLMVSADVERKTAVQCIERGAVDYLPKPAEPAILRARITSSLATKRLHDREMQLRAQRTAMLAGISHDLRQPLQAVRLYGDALATHVSDSGRELLALHGRAVEAAVDILDQFAQISAHERGQLQPHVEQVDVATVIGEVCSRVAATQDRMGPSIVPRTVPVRILADRTMLARIVQNLVENALRCTAAAGRATRPRVIAAVRRREPGICIDIVDNGPGIPRPDWPRAFEPYTQLQAGGSQGLGLAVVAALCRELGFAAPELRSIVGRGTRFRVRVPSHLVVPETPLFVDSTLEQSGRRHRLALEGRLIAVLDDDMAVLASLAATLESAGARCIAATTLPLLEQALDERLRYPDALLFDFDLGAVPDGLQAAQRLRARWQHDVPTAIVSGRQPALSDLPSDFLWLPKPIAGAALIDAVHALVSRRR